MEFRTAAIFLVGAAALTLSCVAHASLINLGDGTVKDTDTNLIWLRDWNVNGFQNWQSHKVWAEGLAIAGASDWRLPEIGEYVALWGDVGGSFTGLQSSFDNVQNYRYWSNTNAIGLAFHAWWFGAGDGPQGAGDKEVPLFAVAVRSASVSLPEPSTLALVVIALGASASMRRVLGK